MLVAVGAGLVEMVCNLTIGKPRYAEHEELMRGALAIATEIRRQALDLVEHDATAFTMVTESYKMPKDTDEAKARRTRSIQIALAGAAEVPLGVAVLATEVIGLADRIMAGANVNVISDVAVAASAGRAALDAAAINVEINLAAISDQDQRVTLRGKLDQLVPAIAVADRIVAAVRQRIGGAE
jgi:methenyltetrahydrofolate cyclohydrolase